jgi:hypothetical protein
MRQFLTYEAYEAVTMRISETPTRRFFGIQTCGLLWLSHGVGGTRERRNIFDAFDELYMTSKILILLQLQSHFSNLSVGVSILSVQPSSRNLGRKVGKRCRF